MAQIGLIDIPKLGGHTSGVFAKYMVYEGRCFNIIVIFNTASDDFVMTSADDAILKMTKYKIESTEDDTSQIITWTHSILN